MDYNIKTKLVSVPIKIITVIVAFMILLRFGFVFYDFLKIHFTSPRPSALKR